MRYVWRGGNFVNPRTGERMSVPDRDEPCCPLIHSDIEEYRSPIDGKLISSRTTRRYDLESNNCVEVDPPKRPRGYINPEFARKRGLKINEEAQEKYSNEKQRKRNVS